MSKLLVMNFLTNKGKNMNIKVKDIKPDVEEKTVEEVMNTIIDKNVFLSAAGKPVKIDSAQVVETIVTELNV
ncbi:DUF2922 domain-containing protein [Clostridium massiliodielmoense]|uniref:DUF2922 domain-containing protein n=1 Tax=Clostridium massiliodielmoense TaxID=1776385 RepID=UPI0004D9CCD6|nr:DUF2922 domain-containing protein [Clostridium massiliodielmoense]KEH98292.1 hypothetical protein Z962_12635 [Clostridium botulinum C/D str. BKT12695]